MEIGLQIIEGNQISVTCNQEFSHSFPGDVLAPIYTEEIPSDSIAVGKILYQCVFQKDSLAQTTLSSNPERILFVPDNPELDALPWEALYGPDGFLVLDFPFVRGLPEDKRIPAPDLSNLPLQVFAILSNPLSEDLPRLNTKLEWMILVESINSTNNVTCLERVFPPTLEQTRLLSANKKNSIIHFFGHGEANCLYFEEQNGSEVSISSQDFYRRFGKEIFLVSLTACDSAAPGSEESRSLIHSIVTKGIPYVFGMRFPIRVNDASKFVKHFYAELSRGTAVEVAFHQSRLTLFREADDISLITPILYTSLNTSALSFSSDFGEPSIIDHAPIINLQFITQTEGKFHGRILELRMLGNQFTGHTRAKLITIHGVGGQGKTALAYEAVQRFSHAWQGGVYAFSMEYLPTYNTFCNHIGKMLGIFTEDYPQPHELEYEIIKILNKKHSLLLFDNFETLIEGIRNQSPDAIQIGTFIREKIQQTNVTILVTSREVLGWPNEITIPVNGLDINDGKNLFLEYSSFRRNELIIPKVETLIKNLDGHPLALLLLAKMFNDTTVSFDDFVQTYEKQIIIAEDVYKDISHRHRTVFACINTSISTFSTEEQIFLSTLGIYQTYFLPDNAIKVFNRINESAKLDFPDDINLSELLYKLWKRGLLIKENIFLDGDNITLYRTIPIIRIFINKYFRSYIQKDTIEKEFSTEYFNFVENIYRKLNTTQSASYLFQQCETDILSCAMNSKIELKEKYTNYIGVIFKRLGNLKESFTWLELSISNSTNQEILLASLSHIASIYKKFGKIPDALHINHTILKKFQESKDIENEAAILNELGSIHSLLGNLKDAIDYYSRARSVFQDNNDLPNEMATLNNLALLLTDIGESSKAIIVYNEILPITKALGHLLGEATASLNLSEILRKTGSISEAVKLNNRALELFQSLNDVLGEANSINNLGLIYQSLGKLEKAKILYTKALDLFKSVDDRLGEASATSNLATILISTNQNNTAIELYNKSKKIYEEIGDKHGTALILNNLADIYSETNQLFEAEMQYKKALAIFRSINNYAGITTSLSNLAHIYSSMGKNNEALNICFQILPMRVLAGDQQGEAITINLIASLQNKNNKKYLAVAYYLKAIKIAKKINNSEHLITMLSNIALTFLEIGQNKKSKEFFFEALSLCSETEYLSKKALLKTYLAWIFNTEGDIDQVVSFYKEAMQIFNELNDIENEFGCCYSLAFLFKEQKENDIGIDYLKKAIRLAEKVNHIELTNCKKNLKKWGNE